MRGEHLLDNRDPEPIPYLGTDEILTLRHHDTLQQLRAEPVFYGPNVIAEAYERRENEIRRQMGHLVTPLIQGESPASHSHQVATLVPIGVEVEDVGDIIDTFNSLAKSADELTPQNGVSSAGVFPYFNYQVWERRDRPRAEELSAKANEMLGAILEVVMGHNVDIIPAIAPQPPGATITRIRQSQLDVITGYYRAYNQTVRSRGHKLPVVLCDVDTTLTPESLKTVVNVMHKNRIVFLGPTMHYTGGVMKESISTVADMPLDKRLVYFVEHLRRAMFDHLAPNQVRGYLPEAAMAARRGDLLGLGGFNLDDDENESYWLIENARLAVHKAIGPDKVDYRLYSEFPYLDDYLIKTLREVVNFESRDRFGADTSIRGIEDMVERYGPRTLVSFDQGHHYSMRTTNSEEKGSKKYYKPLEAAELLALLNSAYSYFEDVGGELRMRDLSRVNQLFYDLFEQAQQDLFLGKPVWLPRYIEKGDRLKVD